MNTMRLLVTVLLACLLCTGPALAGCPVEAEKDAKAARGKERELKALLGADGGDGLEQVILTEPGTATTIAPGRGLEQPRPWTASEKHTLDRARVNTELPEPEGVW